MTSQSTSADDELPVADVSDGAGQADDAAIRRGAEGAESHTFYFERRRNFRDSPEQTGSSIWLVSFTDIIALMLTFFVLLYAMSDPVQQKWDNKMSVAPPSVVQYSGSQGHSGSQEGINLNRMSFRQAENLDYAEAVLQEVLNESEDGRIINIVRQGDELRLSFVDAVFADDGGDFSPEMTRLLRRMGPVLNNIDNSLVIVGHAELPDQHVIFNQTQNFAKALQKADYKKPLALSVQVSPSGQWVDMVLRPHDGYRITR